jgi:hypothetical protein
MGPPATRTATSSLPGRRDGNRLTAGPVCQVTAAIEMRTRCVASAWIQLRWLAVGVCWVVAG